MALFEDLSGEILMAIFEYMHVEDVWTIFFNMNYRLNSLVFDSRLRLTADVSNIDKNDFNQFCSSLINTNFSNIFTLILSNNLNRYPQIRNFLSQTNLQHFQSLHALTLVDINYDELLEISKQIKTLPFLNYLHINTHEIFREKELSKVSQTLLDQSKVRVSVLRFHEKIQWLENQTIEDCKVEVLSLDYINADRLVLLLGSCPNVRSLTSTVDSRPCLTKKIDEQTTLPAIVINPCFAQITYFRLCFRPFNASVLEELLQAVPNVRRCYLETPVYSAEYLRSPFWTGLFQKTLPKLERIRMVIRAWLVMKSTINQPEEKFDQTNIIDGYRYDRYWLDRAHQRSFHYYLDSSTAILQIR